MGEVTALLSTAGYRVTRMGLREVSATGRPADLAVAVSYACARQVATLQRLAPRIWLDAVDSWLLVNGSGLRRGRPGYLARALRDGARLALMPTADVVTYISGADLHSDRGTIRAGSRWVLPGSTPTLPVRASPSGRRLVLAGDWDYPPNADALAWFRTDVLPQVDRALPTAGWSATVYGTGRAGTSGGRLEVMGYADDPGELYQTGDVHVAPVRFGGGVKRKVLQPLLSGLPVVTTTVGAHGLRPHPLLHVHDSAASFAAALVRLLGQPANSTSPPQPDFVYDRDDTQALLTWLRA
ncbi:MAG: hypothetical protein NVS3B26_11520 [Mycobacteriales bacterium]